MDWEEAIREVRFLQNPFLPNARTCEVLDSDVDLFTANVQVRSPLLVTEARANPNFREKERNELTKKCLNKSLAKNTGLSDFCRKVNWIFRRYN